MTAATAASPYHGVLYRPEIEGLLRQSRIVPATRSVSELVTALAARVEQAERSWSTRLASERFATAFASDVDGGRSLVGTPALTNVWYSDRPLGSCTAPTSAEHCPALFQGAEQSYLVNMGAGYQLDTTDDPVGALFALDEHAAGVQASGACERYVGNIAILTWDHPQVHAFIDAKVDRPAPHFNISIAIDASGEARWRQADPAVTSVVRHLAETAWACGDPGLVLPHRYQVKNPLAEQSPFTTTAPCAEVGLAPGDTCVFGYINLAAHSDQAGSVDHDQLSGTARRLTRALDNLAEATSANLATVRRHLAENKRRIGVSVCGYADLLVLSGTAYGTERALKMLAESLNTVRFAATTESVDLAVDRGPFGWFHRSSWATGSKAPPDPGDPIDRGDWSRLFNRARTSGVRNSSITALPPSGRTSILLGVNPSIEPFLDPPSTSAHTPGVRAAAAGTPGLDSGARSIGWQDHVAVVEAATDLVDDAVSKTVNLPSTATVEDVWNIFTATMATNICAMSIYRDQSRRPMPSTTSTKDSPRPSPQ